MSYSTPHIKFPLTFLSIDTLTPAEQISMRLITANKHSSASNVDAEKEKISLFSLSQLHAAL